MTTIDNDVSKAGPLQWAGFCNWNPEKWRVGVFKGFEVPNLSFAALQAVMIPLDSFGDLMQSRPDFADV
jgi:hypothetical protein